MGLVHFAASRKGRETLHEEHRFGDIGRLNVQAASVEAAFKLHGALAGLAHACP
ncbi:MAG: hypothetical protein WDM79_16690 [Terricaulis sp.]